MEWMLGLNFIVKLSRIYKGMCNHLYLHHSKSFDYVFVEKKSEKE